MLQASQPRKASKSKLQGARPTLEVGRLTMVSAAFFARRILDWVEKCRRVAELTPKLPRDMLNKSPIPILMQAWVWDGT